MSASGSGGCAFLDTHPLETHTLGHPTVNKRAVHILLECLFSCSFSLIFDNLSDETIVLCIWALEKKSVRGK